MGRLKKWSLYCNLWTLGPSASKSECCPQQSITLFLSVLQQINSVGLRARNLTRNHLRQIYFPKCNSKCTTCIYIACFIYGCYGFLYIYWSAAERVWNSGRDYICWLVSWFPSVPTDEWFTIGHGCAYAITHTASIELTDKRRNSKHDTKSISFGWRLL
jgi:hypothetical protein